ncbi:MAG: hypothetical protein LBV17_08545 [Treponema sp.]|jgi:hypothetical protein|nr:hypothetical protein [Treponema sp.]
MRKTPFLIIFFSLLFFACEGDDSVKTGKFWVQNFSTSSYYQIDAELLAENNLCYVWVEKGSGVSEATAEKVAYTFKEDIYLKMWNTFGYIVDWRDEKGKSVAKLNTIQSANYIATGDTSGGKLTILLLDIKDDYKKGVNDSYVAGYFWAGNLYENGLRPDQPSNERDMIYVDINPGVPGEKDSNETLAHELQHLMNFVSSCIFREKGTDLWIDEGLSVTAEWVYSGKHSEQRLSWSDLNGDGKEIKGSLDKGNNFFVWGNRTTDKNPYPILDDYSTVYLFFQWLGLQADNKIYKEISISKNYDYNAVINAFNSIVSVDKYMDWKAMLEDWLIANYNKSSSGRWGYGSDTELNKIKTHYAPGGSTSIDLFQGEGVYSKIEGTAPSTTPAGNIRYKNLSSVVLLTYNANTNVEKDGNYKPVGVVETGTITGVAPPPSANIFPVSSGGRSISGIGPFPIGAGDMLRQKSKKDGFSGGMNFTIPDTYRKVIVDE